MTYFFDRVYAKFQSRLTTVKTGPIYYEREDLSKTTVKLSTTTTTTTTTPSGLFHKTPFTSQ